MPDQSGSKGKAIYELTPEDLGGFSLDELKCRACSGYGNCGYRMYRLHEGKPVLICQQRKLELERQGAADAAAPADGAARDGRGTNVLVAKHKPVGRAGAGPRVPGPPKRA